MHFTNLNKFSKGIKSKYTAYEHAILLIRRNELDEMIFFSLTHLKGKEKHKTLKSIEVKKKKKMKFKP